eukprot:PhF_6_TR28152/c0_g1_i1/m.41701
MGMDKNIKYVRENRIAPLLNDMVMHLLATTPQDPLQALISYMERRQHQDRASRADQQGSGSGAADQQQRDGGRKAAAPGKGGKGHAKPAAGKEGSVITPAAGAAADGDEGARGFVSIQSVLGQDSEVAKLLAQMLEEEESFAAKVRKSGADPETLKAFEQTHNDVVEATRLVAKSQVKVDAKVLDMPLPRIQNYIANILNELERNEQTFLAKIQTTTETELDLKTYGIAVQQSGELSALVKESNKVMEATRLATENVLTKSHDLGAYMCQKGLDLIGQMRRSEAEVGGELLRVFHALAPLGQTDDALTLAVKQHLELTKLLDSAEMNQVSIEAIAKNGRSLGCGGFAVLQEVTKDVNWTTQKLKVNFQSLGGARIESEDKAFFDRIRFIAPKKQIELILSEIAKEEAYFLESLTFASYVANDAIDAVLQAKKNSQELLQLTVDGQAKARDITNGVPKDLKGIATELKRSSRDINARVQQLFRSTALSAAKPCMSVLDKAKAEQAKMTKELTAWKPSDKDGQSEQKQALTLCAQTMEAIEEVEKMTKLLTACIKHK